MLILHTSDLHLRANSVQTLNALKAIIEAAKQNKVDLVTIAGDIYDSPRDADSLRGTTRSLFDGLPFRVVAIPGNHDSKILSRDLDYGFTVLSQPPSETITIDNVHIVAVPYNDSITNDELSSLSSLKL